MSAINPPLPDFPAMQRDVRVRLESFRAKLRRHLALEGFARVFAELIALLLVSFILDRLLRLSVPTRLALLAAGAIFLAYETWRYVWLPSRLQVGLVPLAAAIDRATTDRPEGTRPVLASRVASILELPAMLDGPSAPSADMVRVAVTRCHDALDAVNFDDHLNAARRRNSLWLIAALALLPLILAAISPASARLWFLRYFAASHQPWPQKTYLVVQGLENGQLIVPRAEPFALRVVTREGSVDPATVTLRYREGAGAKSTVAMSRFAPGDWRYDFPPLGAEAKVEVSGNDDVEEFSILPVDRPRIAELILESQHPTELQPTTHNFAGLDADLSFLPKTKLTLTFTANVPIEQAKLKSNVTTPSSADLRRVNDRTFSLTWAHEAPVGLQIELVGAGAHLASVPTPVSVGLKTDLPPRVGLTFSGVRQRITPAATIPLSIQARDDYGIAKLDLATKSQVLALDAATSQPSTAPSTQPTADTVTTTLVGPVIPPTSLEVQLGQKLDVASLKLPAGSILTVTASATDDAYLAPQTGTSRALTFRVVPADELFREILLRQQGERVKFRKQLDAARKLKESLATTQPADAAREHRAIQREVLRISNSLSESMTEMKLNALGGREAWDLMDNKVLAPLKKLNDDAMNRQKDALDAFKVGDPATLADVTQREDQIIATMQDVLKQMSQWDSFVDVINQLNEIIKLENAVHQSTDKLRKKQTEGVFE